jgi:VanZ family protein
MREKSKLNLLYYYLPAIAVAAVIFYFSSIPGLKVGSPSVAGEIIGRKIGHLAEFMLLAFLVWRILYYYHNLSLRKSVWSAFFLVFAYAISDELHQSFTPERAGKLIDVIFDSVSAFLALTIIVIFIRKKMRVSSVLALVGSIVMLVAMEMQMIEIGNQDELARILRRQSPANQDKAISQGNENDTNSFFSFNPSKDDSKQETADGEDEELPKKVSIPVPFTSQAPHANWDEYHEEACEEASLVMVRFYLEEKDLSKDIAEKEIQGLIKYQLDHYGDYKDSTAEQLVRLAEEYYGMKNLEVVYDFQAADIKKYLAKGKPIIIPAAGRKLGNPNFTAPGPLYHNLVLVGYKGDTIITNDPGTRKGEKYAYSLRTIYDSIHDFPGKKEDIEQGRKAMIVIREK